MGRQRFYITERELFGVAPKRERDQTVTQLPPMAIECEHCGEGYDPDKTGHPTYLVESSDRGWYDEPDICGGNHWRRMMSPQETPEQRMRAGLYAVYSRWQTIRSDGWGVTSLSTAMALEAIRALAEAYPDDPLYRLHLTEIEAEHGDLPRSEAFERRRDHSGS